MLRQFLAAVAAIPIIATASFAATIVENYDVTSYAGPPGGHSLFMNGEKHYFDPGASFKVHEDGGGVKTGSLIGTALNQAKDAGYEVSLSFANFRDWSEQSAAGKDGKTGGGGDKTTWTYMDLVADSTLTGLLGNFGNDYDLLMKPLAPSGKYTFQYGDGANDKNGHLGLSGWFFTAGNGSGGTGHPCAKGSSVCDFNLKLSEVPVPAGAALLPVGLALLVGLRRRRCFRWGLLCLLVCVGAGARWPEPILLETGKAGRTEPGFFCFGLDVAPPTPLNSFSWTSQAALDSART